jgi:hypothetical protein
MAEQTINVTTAGANGSASGTGTSGPLWGVLWGVSLAYHASAPNTTDVTVSVTLGDGTSVTLLVNSNSATNVYKQPRIESSKSSDGSAAGVYDPFYLCGQKVTVSLTQSNALTNAVVVTLILRGGNDGL